MYIYDYLPILLLLFFIFHLTEFVLNIPRFILRIWASLVSWYPSALIRLQICSLVCCLVCANFGALCNKKWLIPPNLESSWTNFSCYFYLSIHFMSDSLLFYRSQWEKKIDVLNWYSSLISMFMTFWRLGLIFLCPSRLIFFADSRSLKFTISNWRLVALNINHVWRLLYQRNTINLITCILSEEQVQAHVCITARGNTLSTITL
jgi:hypothetical protein